MITYIVTCQGCGYILHGETQPGTKQLACPKCTRVMKFGNRLPTIHDIRFATEEKSPHFFDRKTLKFFGQTMASFIVFRHKNKLMIAAPVKDSSGKRVSETLRQYRDGDLINVDREAFYAE